MNDDQEVLLNVLTMAITVVSLLLALSLMMRSSSRSKGCKVHRWSHHPETKKLTCTECSYVAGTDEGS